MNSYQIADLERLTGIKAHTIRIWEKRYKLIEPRRTATNIRYYDDEQARKLLNVATLLAQGHKISHVAALSEKELNKQLQSEQHEVSDDNVCVMFINDLTASMLSFDEVAFEKTFSAAVTRFGMYDTIIKVIYPFLYKVGILWSADETSPAQEHFATCVIRKKLMAAIDGIPAHSKKSKRFLLFLPPDELHETGLLLSDYMIRSKGYESIYLGQNVPFESLTDVIKKTKPSHIITFFIARRDTKDISDPLKELVQQHKNTKILVGIGSAMASEVEIPKKIELLKSPKDLLKEL